MKTNLLFFLLVFSNIICLAQTTYVPDNDFEQALIDLGYDDVLDDFVLTANINTVGFLNVAGKNISDLTGIEDFVALTDLHCGSNNLSSLDVTQNTALTTLRCYINQITSLDVSQNTALEILECGANQIPSLNITQNPHLVLITCDNNQLTSLDVSQNTSLEILGCWSNQLTVLNVSQNPSLTQIFAFNNQITSLDVTLNPDLTFLHCNNNRLTCLHVQNGNNTAMIGGNSQIGNTVGFNAVNNPSLNCIEVDDATWSTANWTNIDVQTSFSEDCDYANSESNFDELYLYPYNFHLTMNSTSSEPLVVKNEFGEIVPGNLQFYGYNTDLISISTDGYITGLREENSNEIGTWITATIDGQPLNNTCVVRVLSQDYGFNFISETTSNTILYYPTVINGENIQQYVSQYEIPTVNQYIYEIQNDLMALQPFNGIKQILEVDFGETEQQRVCGISGNPLRLGWNIQGTDWQNCFLVPFTPPRSPQWFVIAHEIGHNFTLASNIFSSTLGTGIYVEGIASSIGLECYDKILTNNLLFPIQSDAQNTIQNQVNLYKGTFTNAFNNWISNGAPFNLLSADIVDGIYFNYEQLYPENFGKRFYLPLQISCSDELNTILNDIAANGENGKHTFYAALISAVIKEDISQVFISSYHYPIVQSLFDEAYPVLMNLMDTTVLTIDAKIFLEGPYDSNTGLMRDDLRSSGYIPLTSPYADAKTAEVTVFNLGGTSGTGLPKDDIVDWVWVEIRSGADGTTVMDAMSALFQRDGDLVGIDGTSPLTTEVLFGNYYLMISHRNHLGVITANTVSLSSCSSLGLDLTFDSTLVEGKTNGIKAMGDCNLALFAGDFSGNGQIQNSDVTGILPFIGLPGYENADIDMNGQVQNSDIQNLTYPNIGKGEQQSRKGLFAKRREN